MTLVVTALNLGEKMKNYPQVLTFFIKPQPCLFHVAVLLTTAKKWTKVKRELGIIELEFELEFELDFELEFELDFELDFELRFELIIKTQVYN